MHTIVHLAAGNPFSAITSTLTGLLAQAVAVVSGAVVGIATIYLIILALKHMGKGWEKLLVAAGGVVLAVIVAFIVFVFAVGRAWATITSALATLKKMHERLDATAFQVGQQGRAHAPAARARVHAFQCSRLFA